MILVTHAYCRNVENAEIPLKKEVIENPEAERGEGPPPDVLSENGLSQEIEQPAPINEIPEGNDGIWLIYNKKWIKKIWLILSIAE